MSLSDQVSEDLEVIAAWRKEDTKEEEELQVSMVGKGEVDATWDSVVERKKSMICQLYQNMERKVKKEGY